MSFITTQEVADMLKVNTRTIWVWRKEGLPFIKINTSVRFDREAVLNWVEQKNKGA